MSGFREHYSCKQDDELVELALTGELVPEAVEALRAELLSRGISNLSTYEKLQYTVPPKKSYRGGIFFLLFCVVLGFAPLIMMILFTPVASHFGCSGNEGAGVVCRGNPRLSSTASAIFGLGVWGCFVTVPVAAFIFLVGVFAGVMAPSKPTSEAGTQVDAGVMLDASGRHQDLYCPSCGALVPPEDYRGACSACHAAFGVGSAWGPQPKGRKAI